MLDSSSVVATVELFLSYRYRRQQHCSAPIADLTTHTFRSCAVFLQYLYLRPTNLHHRQKIFLLLRPPYLLQTEKGTIGMSQIKSERQVIPCGIPVFICETSPSNPSTVICTVRLVKKSSVHAIRLPSSFLATIVVSSLQ
jgi:hypothetical protein